MTVHKCRDALGGSIHDEVDVVVSGRPGIGQKLFGHLFISRIHGIAEPVQGRTQGGSPTLVPTWVAAAVAPAIGTPTFYTVLAAP